MTGLELGLLIGSGVTIALIFTVVAVRSREGKLPAPVLLALRITLGLVFVVLGVIGSLLPVLQGWLFFLIAGLILFPRSRFAVRACDKIQPRMPRLVSWLRKMGIGTHEHEDGPSPS